MKKMLNVEKLKVEGELAFNIQRFNFQRFFDGGKKHGKTEI